MCSGKLICVPPHLADISLVLPLKQFQCGSDWHIESMLNTSLFNCRSSHSEQIMQILFFLYMCACPPLPPSLYHPPTPKKQQQQNQWHQMVPLQFTKWHVHISCATPSFLAHNNYNGDFYSTHLPQRWKHRALYDNMRTHTHTHTHTSDRHSCEKDSLEMVIEQVCTQTRGSKHKWTAEQNVLYQHVPKFRLARPCACAMTRVRRERWLSSMKAMVLAGWKLPWINCFPRHCFLVIWNTYIVHWVAAFIVPFKHTATDPRDRDACALEWAGLS